MIFFPFRKLGLDNRDVFKGQHKDLNYKVIMGREK